MDLRGDGEAPLGDHLPVLRDPKTGRLVDLKWHRLRRRLSDPPFLPDNLEAAARLGATIEVDLRRLADGHFAILHDATLEAETTGTGPVAALTRAQFKALRLRGSDGTPTGHGPLLLSELIARLNDAATHPGFALHLDLKADGPEIDARTAETFAATLGRHGGRCELGCLNWQAARRLGAAVPDMTLAFDPTRRLALTPLSSVSEARETFARILTDTQGARLMFLQHGTITGWSAFGINPVALCQEAGRRVDAWTIDPDTPDALSILNSVIEAGVDRVITNAPYALAALWDAAQEAAPST